MDLHRSQGDFHVRITMPYERANRPSWPWGCFTFRRCVCLRWVLKRPHVFGKGSQSPPDVCKDDSHFIGQCNPRSLESNPESWRSFASIRLADRFDAAISGQAASFNSFMPNSAASTPGQAVALRLVLRLDLPATHEIALYRLRPHELEPGILERHDGGRQMLHLRIGQLV